MSHKAATETPSSNPPVPTGPRPKVTNRGRTIAPIATSNSDAFDIPDKEYFGAPGPRGYPPLTGEGQPAINLIFHFKVLQRIYSIIKMPKSCIIV